MDIKEARDQAWQKKESTLIMAVSDGDGNKHYIFGDDFAAAAITDVLNKTNETEAYYAEKDGKVN